MARLHRISGRFGSARAALKSASVEKAGPLYRVETVLLSAPTADVDAAGRVRALESLDAVTLAMPTVWAVRTQAAIALGRLEAARSLVLGAPKGTVRAQFLTILKQHIKKKKVVKNESGTQPIETSDGAQKGITQNEESATVRLEKKPENIDLPTATAAINRTTRQSRKRNFDRLMTEGSRLLESGKVGSATKKFEAAVGVKPKRPEPYAQLGWCAINLRTYRKAIMQFKKSLKLRPTYADGLFGLGVAYEKVGNRSEAVRVLQSYLRSHPNGGKSRMVRHRLERLKP